MVKLTFDATVAMLKIGGSIRYGTIYTVYDRNGTKYGYIDLVTFLKLQYWLPLVKTPRNTECTYDEYKVK